MLRLNQRQLKNVWAERYFCTIYYASDNRWQTDEKQFLNEYSKQFNTLQLNATFYSIPKSDDVKSRFSIDDHAKRKTN